MQHNAALSKVQAFHHTAELEKEKTLSMLVILVSVPHSPQVSECSEAIGCALTPNLAGILRLKMLHIQQGIKFFIPQMDISLCGWSIAAHLSIVAHVMTWKVKESSFLKKLWMGCVFGVRVPACEVWNSGYGQKRKEPAFLKIKI